MGGLDGPFVGTEALAAGWVSRRGLRSRYRAVYRNVYIPKGDKLSAVTRAQAAWLWSGRQATLTGLSAAAVHGMRWIDADLPAELNRASGKGIDGILISRDQLAEDEVCRIGGMLVTTPGRTAFDLGRRPGRTRAVIRLDALSQATGVQPADVLAVADRHRGARGIVRLRRALDVMDGGAESPQETRTRLVLVDAGLRRPQTQIVVHDEYGYGFARIDMGWERWRVGVEYDGPQHWTDPGQHEHDINRHAELQARGWRVVRVSAHMLRYRRHVIVERACDALRAAGCTNPFDAERPVTARVSRKRVS